uniref:Uncharacterized protein n=1 Tax=Chlamydomonas euryale TaxID=1486919 RepID=A0A7R9V0C9_9CHLO|mmetsp:Transcript_12041/g.35494  ORF Transcript_12041/g.35494 Transcript_12041/m.35494 type:complete len:114 (+) Transcript_12041:84-425(+)
MSTPEDAAAGAASDLGVDDVRVESEQLAKLTEQKEELLARVTGLKKELGDWRGKLDGQVKSFQGEIADLRKTLNTEVDSLRSEFVDLKSALKTQLELTQGLSVTQHEATNKTN